MQTETNIKAITSDLVINRIIKRRRKNPGKEFFLFHSPWDLHCITLNNRITEGYSKTTNLNLVNSFTTPALFGSEANLNSVTKTPTLITMVTKLDDNGKMFSYFKVDDYLPSIYRVLDVG